MFEPLTWSWTNLSYLKVFQCFYRCVGYQWAKRQLYTQWSGIDIEGLYVCLFVHSGPYQKHVPCFWQTANVIAVKPAHKGQIRSHEKLTVGSRWPLRATETWEFFFHRMLTCIDVTFFHNYLSFFFRLTDWSINVIDMHIELHHIWSISNTVETALKVTPSIRSPVYAVNCLWHPCHFTI